jgi:hypothetical protein
MEVLQRPLGAAHGNAALKKELFDDLLIDVHVHPSQNAYQRFKVPDVEDPVPFVAKALNRTKVNSEYQIVEKTISYSNRQELLNRLVRLKC